MEDSSPSPDKNSPSNKGLDSPVKEVDIFDVLQVIYIIL